MIENDFPFYDGRPVLLSARQWATVIGGVVLGFLALTLLLPRLPTGPVAFLPPLLFVAIPLAALAYVAPRNWTALFRKVGVREVLLMVAFAILNILGTMLVGFVIQKVQGVTPNAAIAELASMTAGERIVFFAKTAIQLMGEEIFTILPFLALLQLLYRQTRLSRGLAILAACFLSAAWFGAAHLPTYDWNFVQCFVIIGVARLILIAPYLLTKNLWTSTGAHVLNDWMLFGMSMLGSHLLDAAKG